ncbi:sugar phosphate nucleotidyltransferase [Desulforegula conservatrix]|uniref:sugar phosphate nucleotidyltransferase n=1 Tax=Desulforegula conservatrix TaxID=153026 RepID=UPI000420DEE3|nr:sugar phosphate nucleotidyltransferase [Desulforegula conservatrix]
MKALVLAAGLGTRLRPYTYVTPKPLFTIEGVAVLDRIITQLVSAGCSAIMVNTHHLAEKIEAHVKKGAYHADVRTVYEPAILDTGGAIRNIAEFWDDEPFFVVNSDIFTDFDFRQIYRHHAGSRAAATLLMHDDPRFNNVAVDFDGSISEFRVKEAGKGRLLAFTGIQVVSPVILDFIPENIPSSIIEAYSTLISDGINVRAFVPDRFAWEDIGTPEAYLGLSRQMLAASVLGAAPSDMAYERLKGDGSDRQWFRVSGNGGVKVLAEHGIKNSETICEAESFVNIGQHLYKKGIPVSEIIKGDVFSGLVFLKDLGNIHLADFVESANSQQDIKEMYKKVISDLVTFSVKGFDGFDASWAWQTTEYSREMVLEKECHYFRDAFIKNYLGLEISDTSIDAAFEYISEGASAKGFKGLMHRDCQSRNIMIKNGKPFFIDYQGARKGPFQYDLASLLIDPYVGLSENLIISLEDYAFECLTEFSMSDRHEFTESLLFCKVARNLQILGAFSFLSMVKGKKNFEKYIPASIQRLVINLELLPDQQIAFPLVNLASRARQIISNGYVPLKS